jgi:quercetin dioxygenase-like cupin family protein
MLDTRAAPGDTVPLHTHRWASVLYVLSWSDCVRRDGDGRVLMDSRLSETAPHDGTVLWTAPLEPHSLENVGQSELRVLSVELKNS